MYFCGNQIQLPHMLITVVIWPYEFPLECKVALVLTCCMWYLLLEKLCRDWCFFESNKTRAKKDLYIVGATKMISRAGIYQKWCLIIDALKPQLYHSVQFPFPFCYTSESKTQDIESVIGINNNAECTETLYESSIILTSIISSLIAAEGF